MINQGTMVLYGLSYCPDTGTLYGRSVYYDTKGYLCVKFRGKRFKVHHLAFIWMTGKLPTKQVDHINRDKQDNRWINLREVTARENSNNRNRRSIFGTGVYWKMGKFQSEIIVNGKRNILGRFDNLHEANRIRTLADINLFDNYEEAWA